MKVSSSIVAHVLARTCLKVVTERLNNADDARQTLRLKNFSMEVYQEFIDAFDQLRDKGELKDVSLLVPFDAELICDPSYRIAENSTITLARNDQKIRKLIYLETREGSDSQSTKDFYTIRDNDFLHSAGGRDKSAKVVAHLVSYSALKCCSLSPANKLLSDCLHELLEIFSKENIDVSTTKFVAFAYACTADLGRNDAAASMSGIRTLVGTHLAQMDMFNDHLWCERETSKSSRLKSNYLLADLAKSETQELDTERVKEDISITIFLDEAGLEYPTAEQEKWKELCTQYVEFPKRGTREQIPFFIFCQIFSKITNVSLLGDLVLDEITNKAAERQQEVISLNVVDGLNLNEMSAAETFLDAEPPNQDLLPLKDLLSAKTRKRIERLVTPKSNYFFNPFVQLARVLTHYTEGQNENLLNVKLHFRIHERYSFDSPALGLFSFLFGSMLKELAVYTQETNSAIQLIIDEQLLSQHDFPRINVEDEEASESLKWDPLQLRFDISEAQPEGGYIATRSEFCSWLPTEDLDFFALWWGLVKLQEFRLHLSHLQFPEDIAVPQFLESISLGHRLPSEIIHSPLAAGEKCNGLIEEFSESRQRFLDEIANTGLHFEHIQSFIDKVIDVAAQMRSECVPKDSWLNEPYQLIASDAVYTADKSKVFVLPSNMIKLQWVAKYLAESFELARKSMDMQIPLNSENGDFYFSWIENLSGSQQPATIVDNKSNLYESHSERGWGEYMLPVNSLESRNISASTPESIMAEVCVKIRQYIHHHPHKLDGLTLTIVSKRDVSFCSRLIQQLKKGEFSSLKVTVNLITLPVNFANAMAHFDETDTENRFAKNGALFPDLELRLFAFKRDLNELKSRINNLETDIAIIPQLLEGGDEYHRAVDNTDEQQKGNSQFRPLFDSPVYIRDSGSAKITVLLKPEKSDDLIDSWSTIVTRQKDLSPVSSDGAGCDYYEKKINFAVHADLFSFLHETAHWVITAERYLKREQLEFLQNRPEIISFKDGVGPGGNYSIIVSSSSGKQFVLSRLVKKLTSIFENADSNATPAINQIAESVYDSAREITPELALDALGVARVSEEIIGLSVARRVIDQLSISKPEHGYTAWVSLDSYKHWFTGGESSTRADMLKIVFDTSGPQLKVGVFVLESKLRKDGHFVEHGVVQVKSTISLVEKFLCNEHKNKKHDAKLWRNQLLNAVRNSGDRAIRCFGDEAKKQRFELAIGDAFRDGHYDLVWMSGLTIQSITSGNIENDIKQDNKDTRLWRIKVGLEGILASFDNKSPLSDAHSAQISNAIGASEHEPVKQHASLEVNMKPQHEDVATPDMPEAPEMVKPSSDITPALKVRYQTVLEILSSKLGLPVTPVGWDERAVIEGPSSFLYRVGYEGSNPREVESKHDALKLNLKLHEDQSIHFSIGGGFINIDVPKNDNERYFISAEDLWGGFDAPTDKLVVPLGIDRFGDRVDVNFSESDSPHLLIGGTTGSGKSEALHTLLCGMYQFYGPEQVELLLIDPKGTEMEMYHGTQFVKEDIAMFEEDAMYLVQKAVDEMQRRFSAFRDLTKEKQFRIPDLATFNHYADKKLPWLVVVIDEYADITSDKNFKKEFENSVKRVAQKGRSAGIHLIVATQKPSAEVISTSLRSNLPAQIALRVKGYNESKVIIEQSGAEALIGKGDSIFKSQSATRRVQCGRVVDISEALRKGKLAV
ncbi:FtsK/SpoIIIE domain-containing protein [Rheinheimera aquimaris]|uniref:FtsK/SpoIIIE domain-containing protein n=1 Tax=Rheinheimera aquimaris TaxID=412437 RepID=UPI003A986F13